jgi:chromosome segregation ATPase
MRNSEQHLKFMNLKMVMEKIRERTRTIKNLGKSNPKAIEQKIREEKRIERLRGEITVYEHWRESLKDELDARGIDIPDSIDDINEYLNENPTNTKHDSINGVNDDPPYETPDETT